jgi:hypothetical protein
VIARGVLQTTPCLTEPAPTRQASLEDVWSGLIGDDTSHPTNLAERQQPPVRLQDPEKQIGQSNEDH